MKSIIEKSNTLLRKEGVTGFLTAVIRRLGTLFYKKRTLVLYRGNLSQQKWWNEPETLRRHTAGVSLVIRQATVDDMPKFAEIAGRKELMRIEGWFREGHICYVALDEEKPVYYLWVCVNDTYFAGEIQQSIRLSKNDVFVHDVVTLPEYRMKHIHQAVVSRLLAWCREKNRTRLYSMVLPETFRAFKIMYERAGFGLIQPLRIKTYTKIFFLKRHTEVELKDGFTPDLAAKWKSKHD